MTVFKIAWLICWEDRIDCRAGIGRLRSSYRIVIERQRLVIDDASGEVVKANTDESDLWPLLIHRPVQYVSFS